MLHCNMRVRWRLVAALEFGALLPQILSRNLTPAYSERAQASDFDLFLLLARILHNAGAMNASERVLLMKPNEDKLALASKVAPAVGLLLFGVQGLAEPVGDDKEDFVAVSEPSTLALLAIGSAAAGVAHAVKKRRKK